MNRPLTIGHVAKKVGIPTKTIRYYEDIQLIPSAKRMGNKYRAYAKEDIARLRLIKQARALGLPLQEIKQLVKEGFDGTCNHLKMSLASQIPQYIASVKKRIVELQALQQQLEKLENGIIHLSLSSPEKQVKEQQSCEVLEQFEKTMTKGGE